MRWTVAVQASSYGSGATTRVLQSVVACVIPPRMTAGTATVIPVGTVGTVVLPGRGHGDGRGGGIADLLADATPCDTGRHLHEDSKPAHRTSPRHSI